jgi:hypothetical protein
MVATPQVGTPQVISSLLHGDDAGILGSVILSEKNARKFGENMPGAYNFLPTPEYLAAVSLPPVSFDASIDKVNTWRTIYGDSITTKENLEAFLGGTEGRVKPEYNDVVNPSILNKKLLTLAASHHQQLSGFNFSTSTNVYQIAGWGKSTPSGIKYKTTKHCGILQLFCINNSGLALDHENIHTIDGDGTVVSPSAIMLRGEKAKTYFVDLKEMNQTLSKNFDHKSLMETSPVRHLLKNIIIEDSEDSMEYVSSVKPHDPSSANLTISIHSPADIHVYDKKGNHTGRIPNPQSDSDLQLYEENIPNSSYEQVGEGKYIHVPNDSIEIRVQGTGVGVFTVKLKESKDNKDTVVEFADIPVNDFTKAIITASPNLASSTLSLDIEGDNKVDFVLKPATEIDPLLTLTAFKQTIKNLKLNPAVEKLMLKKLDKVIKSLTKDKIKAAQKKLEKFTIKLNNKNWKIKKISEAERLEIIKIINELLDTF